MATARQKTIPQRLAGSANHPPSHNRDPIWDFIHAMVSHPNVQEAVEMVTQQSALEWYKRHGAELEQTKRKLEEVEDHYRESDKTRRDLLIARGNTKRFIPSAQAHGVQGDGDPDQAAPRWSWKDRLLISVTLIGALLAILLGGSNVYSNLMSSGNPVFLESPWLAVSLSMLLPLGSLAVKFAANFFPYDSWRQRYSLLIYLLVLVSLGTWSVLFAQNFPGVTGGIDLDTLLDSDNSGPALVWSQLMVEMLSGSALFLAAESIYLKYSPLYYVENLEHIELSKAIKAHTPSHDALSEQRAALHGQIATLEADRQSETNQHVAAFLVLRQRLQAANDPQA